MSNKFDKLLENVTTTLPTSKEFQLHIVKRKLDSLNLVELKEFALFVAQNSYRYQNVIAYFSKLAYTDTINKLFEGLPEATEKLTLEQEFQLSSYSITLETMNDKSQLKEIIAEHYESMLLQLDSMERMQKVILTL